MVDSTGCRRRIQILELSSRINTRKSNCVLLCLLRVLVGASRAQRTKIERKRELEAVTDVCILLKGWKHCVDAVIPLICSVWPLGTVLGSDCPFVQFIKLASINRLFTPTLLQLLFLLLLQFALDFFYIWSWKFVFRDTFNSFSMNVWVAKMPSIHFS